jgi:hypothetical protein
MKAIQIQAFGKPTDVAHCVDIARFLRATRPRIWSTRWWSSMGDVGNPYTLWTAQRVFEHGQGASS